MNHPLSPQKGREKKATCKNIPFENKHQNAWVLYPLGASVKNLKNASFHMDQVPSYYKNPIMLLGMEGHTESMPRRAERSPWVSGRPYRVGTMPL